jgi:hypothetical protein
MQMGIQHCGPADLDLGKAVKARFHHCDLVVYGCSVANQPLNIIANRREIRATAKSAEGRKRHGPELRSALPSG